MPRLFSSKVIFFLIASIAFDVCIIPWVLGGTVKPVVSYLFVPYAALEWHWTKSIPAALMLGFFRDILSVQLFGTEMLALFAAALILNLFIQKISPQSGILKMLATFVFVFFTGLNIVLVHFIRGFPIEFSWFHLSVCFSTAFITTCLMPIVFFLAHRWFREDFRYSHRAI